MQFPLGIIWDKSKRSHAVNQERERSWDQSFLPFSAGENFLRYEFCILAVLTDNSGNSIRLVLLNGNHYYSLLSSGVAQLSNPNFNKGKKNLAYTTRQGIRVSCLAQTGSLLLVKGCSSSVGPPMLKPNNFPDFQQPRNSLWFTNRCFSTAL